MKHWEILHGKYIYIYVCKLTENYQIIFRKLFDNVYFIVIIYSLKTSKIWRKIFLRITDNILFKNKELDRMNMKKCIGTMVVDIKENDIMQYSMVSH